MNPVKSISEFFKTREPKKILVALSGGADSVCLLYALREYGAQICAFHLNHCIRGEEADRDERFCRELCEKLGIEFASKKVDVPRISAEQKCGLEETARNVRYKELELAAKRFSAEYIATAHNADDNAETVKNRLQTYHDLTEPIAEYYNAKGKLIRVDGQGAVEDITARVFAALESIGTQA